MNLLRSTGIIGGMTLISRVFGFVRDMMLSRLLGGSAMGDAWQIAFQLPNIFRRLFAEGAFSAAFVPLFNRHMAEDGERDHSRSQRFANETLSVFLPVLLVFSALMIAAMPWVIWLIDDFGAGGRTSDTSIALARIAFPYLALISVMTLFGAILNSISRFAAVAFAPVLMNLCMIGAMLLAISGGVSGDPETVAFHLAWSVTLAGVLQMLWLFWHARRAGFRFTLLRPRLTPDVRQLGVLILPAVFGAGIYQISRFVDLFFLGRLEEGSFVFLALADRLNQLPLGIIGIARAQRSCPRCRGSSPMTMRAARSGCSRTRSSLACC
jgi:putative peptidoglycan lipid II flippase